MDNGGGDVGGCDDCFGGGSTRLVDRLSQCECHYSWHTLSRSVEIMFGQNKGLQDTRL
jgi:hypothetical protein